MNFNSELFKSITEQTKFDATNNCLISGMELEEHHVSLKCGHKFNYNYILQEVQQQRKKNSLEVQQLSQTQIKCPYCRVIQDGVLPYRMGDEKIKYVNWPLNKCFFSRSCSAIFKRGANKGKQCNKGCFYNLCPKHLKQSKIKYCQSILKTGKNKGARCSYKEFENGYCKVHKPKSK
tara:strand:+ start:871 stop:1401 length:531 start_codon:yes stop_codon:yes gene_type:complete